MRLSQNYFSTLARGGLQGALASGTMQSQSPATRRGNSSSARSTKGMSAKTKAMSENISLNNLSNSSSGLKPINIVTNGNNGTFSSTKKSIQNLYPPDASKENQLSQQQLLQQDGFIMCRYQKRLESLMSGNDLQPLEEEISKEDDDSIIIKVDIQKVQGRHPVTNDYLQRESASKPAPRHRKKSSNKSNPYFPQNGSQRPQSSAGDSQHSSQQYRNSNSQDTLKQLSQESTSHQSSLNMNSNNLQGPSQVCSTQSLIKANSLKTCSSIISGDFNYNSQMEEAMMFDLLKLSEEESNQAPKIFDPQFRSSYEQKQQQPFNQQQFQAQAIGSNQSQAFAPDSLGKANGDSSSPTTQDNTATQSMSSSRKEHSLNAISTGQIQSQKQQLAQPLDYNQLQKEKARQIIEQLKAQQAAQQQLIKQGHSSGGKVEKRLFDYQKKIDEKLEHQRKLKEQQEQQKMRAIPQISDKSNEILMRKSLMIGPQANNQSSNLNGQSITQQLTSVNPYSPKLSSSPGRTITAPPLGNFMFPLHSDRAPNQVMGNTSVHSSHASGNNFLFQNYQVEQRAYFEEQKRKEEQRKKMIEEKEMLGFTGKPQINKKSQGIKRKVDDLIERREVQEKKRQEECQRKTQQEHELITQMQSQRNVNKQSERMIEKRFQGQRSTERVEDRLMREAVLKQKKKERNSQHSQNSKQIFYISDLEPKRNNRAISVSKKSQQAPRVRSRSQNNKDRLTDSPRGDMQVMERSVQQQNQTIDRLGTRQEDRLVAEPNSDLQPLFSQSARIQYQNNSNLLGQSSPSSNNYMLTYSNTVDNKVLQSPFGQSNQSVFSTNLNNFQTSQLVNPQSEMSQAQYYQSNNQQPSFQPQPFNYSYQMGQLPYQHNPQTLFMAQNHNQYQQPLQQQPSSFGGSSQFQFMNPPQANPFSPQRMYAQQIQEMRTSQQQLPFQNFNQVQAQSSQNFEPQNHHQQDNSQNQQFQILMSNNLYHPARATNTSESKVQMISQLNNISNNDLSSQPTPIHSSFQKDSLQQSNLTQAPGQNFTHNRQDDKHSASIKPYTLQNSNKLNLNKGQQQKSKKGYVSLFEKVQRMNTSSTSDQDSSNSQQSLPIVSAQMPLFNNYNQFSFYPLGLPDHQNVNQQQEWQQQQQNQNNYQGNQSRNLNEFEFKNSQNSNLSNKNPTNGSIPSISTINYNDPTSNTISSYPALLTQQHEVNQTIQAPLPDTIHTQLWQYTQHQPYGHNMPNIYGQGMIQYPYPDTMHQPLQVYGQQVVNTQDQIINKILDNSFIPSGNVNQTRRFSTNRGTFAGALQDSNANLEGGTTFALSQYTLDCLQPLGLTSSTRSNRFGFGQTADEYHNIFNERDEGFQSQQKDLENFYKFTPPQLDSNDKANDRNYEDLISRTQNPHLQIIDNDFLGAASNRLNCGSALGLGQMNGGGSLGLGGNQSSKNRLTNENGQMLDTEFIITNSSIYQDSAIFNNQLASNPAVVKNLAYDLESQALQIKSIDHREPSKSTREKTKQIKSRKSSKSPREINLQQLQNSIQANNTSASSGEANPNLTSSLKGLNFLDRNNQWLENKRTKIERKRQEIELLQDRECPFKPQISNSGSLGEGNTLQAVSQGGSKSHTRGISGASQEKAIRLNAAGFRSLSLSKKRSSVDNSNNLEQQEKSQLNADLRNSADNFKDQFANQKLLHIQDLRSSQNSGSNYATARNEEESKERTSQFVQSKGQSLSNSGQPYKGSFLSTEAKDKNQALTRDVNPQAIRVAEYGSAGSKGVKPHRSKDNEFDISGQCDITNLSPDPFQRGRDFIDDSNFDTSFLSSLNNQNLDGKSSYQPVIQSQRGISQVKVMSKKNINF